ncbi:MAG: PASTA domain-containing protein, partial [Nocardioides sp.]
VVPPQRQRRSRRGPIVFLLALLLVAGLGVAAWWFGFARYTPTPAVIGLGKAAAVEKLEAAGLEAELAEKAYSETVPAGKVLGTDPAAGDRVLDGGTVTVTLSLGKERYDVPQLRGMTEDEAQDALTGTSLMFGESTGAWSATVPEGTVIRSDPAAGTTLRPDAVVDLVLSKGPKPIEVRDFTGRSADRATAYFERREVPVEQTEEFSDTVPEGRVISQDPTTGTVFRDETVRLVVSQGPELVEVPSGLVASGVDAARQRLTDLGFQVEVQNSAGYIGLGYVYSTDPEAGTMVPKGTTITLYLV